MCLDSSSGVEETDVDSISVIDDEMNTTIVLGDHGVTERSKGVESHRVAEMWRAGIAGRYRKDEVNLTKIGAAPLDRFVTRCVLMLVRVDKQRKQTIQLGWRQTGSSWMLLIFGFDTTLN